MGERARPAVTRWPVRLSATELRMLLVLVAGGKPMSSYDREVVADLGRKFRHALEAVNRG